MYHEVSFILVKKYEEFLERVRERNADDFSEISDVHGRYKTLKEAYDNLIQRRELFEEQL